MNESELAHGIGNLKRNALAMANEIVRCHLHGFMLARMPNVPYQITALNGSKTNVKLFFDTDKPYDRNSVFTDIARYMDGIDRIDGISRTESDSYSTSGCLAFTLRMVDGIDSTVKLYLKQRVKNGIAYEPVEIVKLNGMLDRIKRETKSDAVKMLIGDTLCSVSKFVKTPRKYVKSDFTALDEHGNQVAWVSYKYFDPNMNGVRSFQQWSGVNARYSKRISKHRDIVGFGRMLSILFPSGYIIHDTLSMPLSDNDLGKLCVYGYDYGTSTYGENNVNTVMQGDCRIDKIDEGVYKLNADLCFHNGEDVLVTSEGDYTPILICRHGRERKSYGIKYARVLVYAKGGRKNLDIFSYIDTHLVEFDKSTASEAVLKYSENNGLTLDKPTLFHVYEGNVITHLSNDAISTLNQIRYAS